MTDPVPLDGDTRFHEGKLRWERYDRIRGWMPIEPPVVDSGGSPHGGGRQVYDSRRPRRREDDD